MSKYPEIQYLVFQYYDYIEYKFIGRSLVSRYPNPLRPYWTSKTRRKSNFLRSSIETQTKQSRNGLKFNIKYSNTMKTQNINWYVVVFCLGTQTLYGRNEPPKHDANLTFYIQRLKPKPKDLELAWNSIFSIPILSQHRISIYRSFSYVYVPIPFAVVLNLQNMTQI